MAKWLARMFREHDTRWISWILGLDALIRGVNYLTIRQLSPALGAVQEAFDMTVWGAVFVGAAAMVFLGYVLRGRWCGKCVLSFGHGVIACVYLGLAAGIATSILSEAPWGDGVRTVATFIAVALIHVVLAWRITEERLAERLAERDGN